MPYIHIYTAYIFCRLSLYSHLSILVILRTIRIRVRDEGGGCSKWWQWSSDGVVILLVLVVIWLW